MGVLGLWQLLAPVGQPVALESLENKIFAVDISIWLNQAIKGYRDSRGGSLPNAHLLSLFSRLCKLLFYRIRPIIVFDGGFPELKKQTIINRQNRRAAVKQSSKDIGMKILTNYVASQNLGQGSGEAHSKNVIKPKEKGRDEIYQLPPLPEPIQQGFSESAEDLVEWKFTNFSKEDIKYLNKIDIESDDFNDLPPDVKQEILSTLKESRRHRTWEQSLELPEDSDEFSNFQLQGLLKKRNLSRKLEQVQKDLRQISAADFVAQYTSDHVLGETNKIMSDDCSHYVLLKKIVKSADSTSKTEDSVEASSSMMDTKNAFIKDLENIDVVDEFFEEKPKNVSGKNAKNIIEDNFDNFSEEDVDNPPEECQVTSVKREYSFEKASSSIDSRVVLSSDDEDIQIPCDKNNHQSDIKVSEPSQSSDKSVSQIPAKVSLLTYPDLNESYLENDFVTISSSDDEMIPCDEIPAESLLSQPCQNPPTAEVDLFMDGNKRSKIDDGETQNRIAEIVLKFNNDSKNPSTKTNSVNANYFPTIENSEAKGKESMPVSLLFPTSTIELKSSIQTTTSEGSNPSEHSVSSTLPVSSAQSASSVPSTSNMSSLSTSAFSVPSTSNMPSLSSTPFNSVPSTSAFPSTSTNKPEELSPETIQRNLELRQELDAANLLLEADQAKLDRQNRTVQDHMIEDCKELLQLFGIPFVVSPTEAEAQCAFYDLANLSHGTITDDSDVWLFGGKRVYKNFFTQQKYVEFFKDHEIFTHFGLSRKKLINFALLTGSDYTEGIEGVGRVTAMEILSEFPGDDIDALCKFKDWWSQCNKHAHPPENKVRAKLLKLVLGESFPDERVFEAYLKPEIDESTERFTWGRPDLDALRDYAKEKFGWNKTKVDEQLLPVIKKLGERNAQAHLDSFFTVSLKKQTELFPSKRMMSAVKKITSPEKGDCLPQTKPSKRRSKANVKKTVQRKAVCRTKQSKPQGPVLSEESSDES